MLRQGGKEGWPVAESSERIQDALAAHLDYIEMGGPEPDIGHLSPAEKKESR